MGFLGRPNTLIGLLAIVFGIVAITVWIPLDTGSGIVEKMRGKYRVGDALAPTMAFIMLIFSGLLLLLESRHSADQPTISRGHLTFAGMAFLVFVTSIVLMRWSGPVAVTLTGFGAGQEVSYRELRDTVPWKYLGFLLGGSFLVGTFICISSHERKVVFFVIGLLAALLMIALYDLAFDDLLLPPNGDV